MRHLGRAQQQVQQGVELALGQILSEVVLHQGPRYSGDNCCLPSPPPSPSPAPSPPPAYPVLEPNYASQLFVDADAGSDSNSGDSPTTALATIAHAISVATDSTAIFVADGTYFNEGYGNGAISNGPAVTIKKLDDLLVSNLPGHRPLLKFDGYGGFSISGVHGLEIRGFEIMGPSNDITYDEVRRFSSRPARADTHGRLTRPAARLRHSRTACCTRTSTRAAGSPRHLPAQLRRLRHLPAPFRRARRARAAQEGQQPAHAGERTAPAQGLSCR